MLTNVYSNSFKNDLILSFKTSIPIVLGYIPLGIASGLLSQKAGLTPFQIAMLSLFTYAGSGQFITASMIISNASILSITLTNLIVNSRYSLMSSTLAPFFKGCKKKFVMLFAHGVTDETFAINFTNFKNKDWTTRNALLVNLISQTSWIVSNISGAYAGSFVNIDTIIINFILTSMFICLLILALKDKLHILAAILSAILSIFFYNYFKNNLYIIFATIISSSICFIIEKNRKVR